MKIKKALACILAMAMVISLMPAMAFASTDNTVSSVIKVEADDQFTAQLNLKVTSIDAVKGSFDIELNNAEWDVTDGADKATVVASDAAVSAGGTSAVAISYTTTGAIGNITAAGITVSAVSVTENTMRVKLETPANLLVKDAVIKLLLNLKAKDGGEDVTVTIADSDAKVSSGTYTVATVGTGGTVASVIGSSIKKVSADGTYTGNTVKISEVSSESVKGNKVQGIRLTLPKNYDWYTPDDTTVAAMFTGDMLSTSPAVAVQTSTPITATNSAISTGAIAYKANENKLDIYFLASGTKSTEILQITPKFTVDSEASTGDVTLTISNLSGDISAADDLVIAQNVVESVEVKTIKNIPELLSGRMYEKDKEDSSKLQYVYITLKENVVGAITDGKSVKFEFPEEVQIATPESIYYSTAKDATKDSSYGTLAVNSTSVKDTYAKDASSFTWKSISPATSKAEYTFKVPVLIEAGYTGEIEVTVSGAKAGIDEQSVVVANVVTPVELEGTVTEIKAGIQNQTIGDIIIKETAKGMLIEEKTVSLVIKDLDSAQLKDSKATIEVTEGDLEIKNFKTSGNTVKFDIKSKSTKPSTIKISGVTLTTDRTPAEGLYDLRIAGNAVVDYAKTIGSVQYTPNNDNFKGYAAKVAGYVNVVTPADSTTVSEKVDAKFVIGEASYTNNGEATEMDAAAYIDSNNRTMVPIRYVANACGISENDIRWEQNTQTAIINGLNTVVTVKMGSNKLQTSTGEITMDTVAVNNNGRIYVPVRYIANALGANVSWDAATKTVTLTK